jgi:hypothetical protein
MKNVISLSLVALSLILTSCSTPRQPQAFHNTDTNALVIKSLDKRTSQMLQPSESAQGRNDQILSKASALPQHQTAVIMLENYNESQLGPQFRERGTPLFIALRGLNYEHIIFVQGKNVSDPNGLITLAEYY